MCCQTHVFKWLAVNLCVGEVCVSSYQLVVHEQIDTEAEGKEQLVLLKQWATHIDIQWVGKVVLQDLQPKEDTHHSILIMSFQTKHHTKSPTLMHHYWSYIPCFLFIYKSNRILQVERNLQAFCSLLGTFIGLVHLSALLTSPPSCHSYPSCRWSWWRG